MGSLCPLCSTSDPASFFWPGKIANDDSIFGSLHPFERPGTNCWLLALDQVSSGPVQLFGSELVGRRFSLSLFPFLSVNFSQIELSKSLKEMLGI